MRSSAHATSGYYDALARAEQRARSAEQRLAAIEQMLADGRPADEVRAAVAGEAPLRRRFMRSASQASALMR